MYANASKDKEAFDGKLEFEVTLIPYTGSTDWIEQTLHDIKDCLESNDIPAAGENCDYCVYRETAGKKFLAHKKAHP